MVDIVKKEFPNLGFAKTYQIFQDDEYVQDIDIDQHGNIDGILPLEGENHMPTYEEFAKLFGLELNEDFRIRDVATNVVFENTYVFRENGFFQVSPNGVETAIDFNENKFISGEWEIVTPFWKPDTNEEYYAIDSSGTYINRLFWYNTFKDLQNFYCGNCFRSQQEASVNKDALISRLGAYYAVDE